jgi:predicted peroxiredoxin
VSFSAQVLINLATGMEDKERVLIAFLVATAAVAQGKEVVGHSLPSRRV